VGTGLFLFEIGSIVGTLGFEYQQKSVALWEAYNRSGAADEGLLSDYSASFNGYRAFGVSSYLLWGAGAAAVSSSLFLFSPQDIGLSRWGRVVFSTGLLLTLTGNIFSSIASSQRSRNTRQWEEYVERGGGTIRVGMGNMRMDTPFTGRHGWRAIPYGDWEAPG